MNVLDKFGVPLPTGGNMSMKMPKLKYKFRVVLINAGTLPEEADYIAIDCDEIDRPSVRFKTQTLHYMGEDLTRVYGHSWNEIRLNLRDSVDNMSSIVIAKQLQKQLDFNRRMTPKVVQKFASYKFTMVIETLSGANPTVDNNGGRSDPEFLDNFKLTNTVDKFLDPNLNSEIGLLDRWVCYGCTITEMNADRLDYKSSSPLVNTLTIKPDNCILYDTNGKMFNNGIEKFASDNVNEAINIMSRF